MLRNWLLSTALVGAAAMIGGTAQADDHTIDYPTDEVRVFVPQTAGGGTDASARLFAEFFNEMTDANMVIVNQKAGGGVVAQQTVLTGPSDGSQLFWNHASTHVANLVGKSPFNYEDYKIMATLSKLSDVVLVSADAPYDTLPELLDYAKANPGELTYVTEFGGTTQVKASALNAAADGGFKVVDGGGGADRIVLMVGGNADVSSEGVRLAKEHTKSGSLKALGVLTAERDPLVPEWPTAKEQGIDIAMPYVFTLSGPKDIDEAAVEAIDAVIEALEGNEDYAARLETLGQSPDYRTSGPAGEFVENEFKTFQTYVKE